MSKSADTVNTTEQKKRKQRVSSREKAQIELKDLIEKRDEIDKQINIMEAKCLQLFAKSDPDLKARAFGISSDKK